jgi:hypothetical protein
MKKPYLSIYERNFENKNAIDATTLTDTIEDTDCDMSLILHIGGTNHTNTLEDTDLDNLLQIDKVYNDKV